MRGYHDKHRVLLEKTMDEMVNFKMDTTRFEIHKENVSDVERAKNNV